MISHWRFKALAQKLFSHVPGGERLNYLAQRYLRHSLEITDGEMQRMVRHVRNCLAIVERRQKRVDDITWFEFGAGWSLLKQLLLSLYGCRRQITVDPRPLTTVSLINRALGRLAAVATGLGHLQRTIRPISCLDDLRYFYGIWYLAPFDARKTFLESGSVDLISSTAALEHVPPHDLRAILREFRRLLAPNGLAIHYVDYTDHFAHTDRSISVYNFLRFSEREWKKYNSSVHYQNRLRHADFVRLFADEEFELVEEHCDRPLPAEAEVLADLPLAPEFSIYPPDQLGIQGALLVMQPAAVVSQGT